MLDVVDVVVVGAGPAGLAAGMALKKAGKKYLILEKGKDLVDRASNEPRDVSAGIGGGGLFSDGKLSFFPSATYLWTRLNSHDLEVAYTYLRNTLKHLNVDMPSFDTKWTTEQFLYEETKDYLSISLNNFMRSRVLNFFYEKNIGNIIPNSCVVKIEKHKNFYIITTTDNVEYYSNKIILACGKFGINLLKEVDSICENHKISKIELGIRVECASHAFIPYSSPSLDYKIIEAIEQGVEFRTFCCCKDGIVLKSEFDQYISHNGARTQFVTNNSNIGLLIRATDKQSVYYQEMRSLINTKNMKPFKTKLKEFLEDEKTYIGQNCDSIIRSKVSKVIEIDNPNIGDFYVYGPEIEYVGEYIITNSNLAIPQDENIWLAGDIAGSFRGLMAAMLSGIYSANNIIIKSNDDILRSIDRLGINISSSKNMELIFTAQSKKFFYCKDVICQYVLEKEKLPINPFRVFDYFLNDRVDRDLIRRGNNQLIQSCNELWVFGPIADGVLFEIALAKLNGKKIRFFSIGTRVTEIEEINDLNDITFEPEVHSKKIKKEDLIKFITNVNEADGQLELSMYF